MVQEAYVQGVSTRKVDELVKALGMARISKSQVSRLCEEFDEEVERFRGRPLEGPYPYVWLDATYAKARQDGRVASTAVVIAVGVNGNSAEREVLGVDVGPSEDGAFWTSFLRSLVARGLCGVRLVTSDAHRGLKGAIEAVLVGASWQRCRVHFMRNALSLILNEEDKLRCMAGREPTPRARRSSTPRRPRPPRREASGDSTEPRRSAAGSGICWWIAPDW